MAKSSKSKSAKKRVKVQNLPAAKKKLTEKDMKKVKGGTTDDNLMTGKGIKGEVTETVARPFAGSVLNPAN